MASRRTPTQPPTGAVAPSPASPRLTQRMVRPLEEFVAPGRRRTDNPLTVGVIVLCLGLITIIGIVQTVVIAWAGAQLRSQLDRIDARDKTTAEVREKLFKNTEAQALVLRRLCINTAKSPDEQKDCLSVGPALTLPKEAR